jgi:hypothetical protein
MCVFKNNWDINLKFKIIISFNNIIISKDFYLILLFLTVTHIYIRSVLRLFIKNIVF